MKDKSILELICDITQEDTDIVIRFDKEHNDLKFRYYAINERHEQVIRESDLVEYKDNPNQLLTYVLEEIQSTILGVKENSR